MKQNNADNLPLALIIHMIIDQKLKINIVKKIETRYTAISGGGIPPPKYLRTKYTIIYDMINTVTTNKHDNAANI